MGIPESDLLGVTLTVTHVAGQRILAVGNGLNQRRPSNNIYVGLLLEFGMKTSGCLPH